MAKVRWREAKDLREENAYLRDRLHLVKLALDLVAPGDDLRETIESLRRIVGDGSPKEGA